MGLGPIVAGPMRPVLLVEVERVVATQRRGSAASAVAFRIEEDFAHYTDGLRKAEWQ